MKTIRGMFFFLTLFLLLGLTVYQINADNNENLLNQTILEFQIFDSVSGAPLIFSFLDEISFEIDLQSSLKNLPFTAHSKPFKITAIEPNFKNTKSLFSISFDNIEKNMFARLRLLAYSGTSNSWHTLDIIEKDKLTNKLTFNAEYEAILLLTDFNPKNFTPAEDANYVVVKPNPFLPNDGTEATGQNYNSEVENSGIIFSELPLNSIIKIYTVNGSFVTEKMVPSGEQFKWDTKNDNGSEVSSGVYIYTLSSPTGNTTGKFVIVR